MVKFLLQVNLCIKSEFCQLLNFKLLLPICILRTECGHFSYPCMQNLIATGFRKGVWKISTAETKIILVLCFYGLFGVLSMSYFALETAGHEDQYQAIQQYFVCEAVGSGVECDRSGFENISYFDLVALVYLMLGLVPAVNLTFVINWTAAKEFLKHFWMKHFPEITSSQTQMVNIQNHPSDTCTSNTVV